MKKKLILCLGALVVVGMTTAQALPMLTGQVGFTGGANLDTSSAGNATAVTGWVNTTVLTGSGSFSSIVSGTPVSIVAPWSFNSGAIPTFWSVGGFTFDLSSSSIATQVLGPPGSVHVIGNGTLKAAGFQDTPGNWSFTTQDPPIVGSGSTAVFTFSASGAVPDNSTTALLLGASLSAIGLLRKRLFA